ncbi:MAG: hemerythrin [Acidimicrobiaceae bacterium]|nr:hemerythrin [Acidimicrobiaceae bacterium]
MSDETQDEPWADSLVAQLLADHREIEGTLGRLDELADNELGNYVCELREQLLRHEKAEETVVYRALRDAVPDGDRIAQECLTEQAEVDETLAELESRHWSRAGYRGELTELRISVLAHARHEEREVFPRLTAHEPVERLAELGEQYEKAMADQPTHRHSDGTTPPRLYALPNPVEELGDSVQA